MEMQEFLLLLFLLAIMFALGFLMVSPLRRQLEPDDAEKRVMIFIALTCIIWVVGISAPIIPELVSTLFAIFGLIPCIAGFFIRIRRIPKKRRTYP